MRQPDFSIAIPTRDRADTLRAALRTCLAQDIDSVEFVISDNDSHDATRAVVEEAADPRVRYVHTGRRLSMAENFEFAYAACTGSFIGFLGDDDGLLPHALAMLGDEVPLADADACIWPSQHYYWPGFFEPHLANTLSVDLRQRTGTRRVSSAHMLREVAAYRSRYNLLPSPYFGVVRRTALEAAKSRRTGRLFNSITPDVYSGIAVARVIDDYLISSRAYTLSGQSRHSNGAAQVTGKGESDGSSETARFLAENAIAFHDTIRYAPSIPVLVHEAFAQALDHVPSRNECAPTLPATVRAALRDQEFLFNPAVQSTVTAALRATASAHGAEKMFADELRRAARRRPVELLSRALRIALGGHLLVDCGPYGVTDVFGAARVHEQLLAEAEAEAGWRGAARTTRARAAKLARMVRAARQRKAT